ncbi:HCL120Wp [Eremothecium sinecaudum]|uniref:Large ribosomal subunit protein bL27m n=1 Tax=Eremothecium sinecaudum TaxID=45286 RepID=A0A0X8HRC1_9SACH|nr:HCL120Wp [Eremothecium sinecaudum]AMD20031.1 HCL120Wp [Eremothecium sinecaudum]
MSLWNQVTKWQLHLSPFIQVRTATKRAAGSRTSMKDSAGRRLGPKKSEGEAVSTGQIIMRQRGTKFYPGENVGIGKDHTIFALEPGFVRYYMDPFHPKRKFIGVALAPNVRLPTPHFDQRMRRFGRYMLTDPVEAAKEEAALPRKTFLMKDKVLEAQQAREQRRQELMNEFERILNSELQIVLEGEALDFAKKYLLRVRSALKNGFEVSDAQFNSLYFLEQELKLLGCADEKLQLLKTTVEHLNKSTSFDNKLVLTRFISEEEKLAWKKKAIEQLGALDRSSKSFKNDALNILADASKYLSLSQEVLMRRQYLKQVLPETMALAPKEGKNTHTLRRYNYEKRSVDVVIRSKDAYFSKL